MKTPFEVCRDELRQSPKTWLVTGVAGFIGSNLLQWLLLNGQKVVGLDNYSTGRTENFAEVRALVSAHCWANFQFIEGDICDLETCKDVVRGVDFVLHNAGLCSVSESLADPLGNHAVNVNGFLNMLIAARDARVRSFTYATSGSVCSESSFLSALEVPMGKPSSPYALSALVSEFYAELFARNYNFKSIGLGYSNVFGPRQNLRGPFAAVIPRLMEAMLADEALIIDGQASSDFCFVANVVQANILAATAPDAGKNEIYNVAVSYGTTMNQLLEGIATVLKVNGVHYSQPPVYADCHAENVSHLESGISKISRCLGYVPSHNMFTGLAVTVPWYMARQTKRLEVSS